MKLSALLSGVSYEIIQGKDIEIRNITHDSRLVNKGTLFVCINGLRDNGHSFAQEAAEQGAAALVIDEDIQPIDDITIVRVDNTRSALAYISTNYYGRPADKMAFIGVTGTKGKTSTSYFIEAILNGFYEPAYAGLIGTVETRIGSEPIKVYFTTSTTPDTTALHHIFSQMYEKGVQHVVMEVSSHALSQRRVETLLFDVAVFTNLTLDHLDYHGTMDNYAAAKALLFTQCKKAVINKDADYSDLMIETAIRNGAEVITYSIEKDSDNRAYDLELSAESACFKLHGESYSINVPGMFSVYNALASICSCIASGVSVLTIKSALQTMTGVRGRMQRIPNNKGITVIVDYAHTPDSLTNVLNTIRDFAKARIITVFGCGGDRDKTKRPIMGKIACDKSDYVVVTSDNPRTEEPESIIANIIAGISKDNYEKITDRRLAIFKAINLAKQDDIVIIAGKGHETYETFADRTIPFDDSEVAKEALDKL
jgi:UDP-N-acetylmuramoyl-L-alanyl-D-glutamate--2,6-diaminopimelate ligase